jgi:rhamnosyl/mannosyltransferase
MRVLHVGKFFAPFVGGIENSLIDLSRAASEVGVRQAVLVHASPAGLEMDAENPRFDFLEAFARVPVLGQLAYAPIAPRFRGELEAMLEDFEPELLHVHLPNPSAFWLLSSRHARRLPWVVHWHSDVVGPGLDRRLKLLYPAYRPFEQALLRRASAIIATSPPYLHSSRALSRWRGKCRAIPLGLDVDRVVPVEQDAEQPAWAAGSRLRVLAVGRLTRYKGMQVLARAALDVPGVAVNIVGEGAERRRLERLIPPSEAGRIRVLGSLDDAARNRLLASCDVFCLPSINRAEAFGMALLEAMACGKPTIATRVPGSGMDWVVEEGRTGWLVDPGDADKLGRLLQSLISNRARLADFGAEAKRRFDQRFRIETVADAVLDVYRDAAGTRRTPAA